VYRLERTQRIPAPISEVFAFFSDPANLGRITPPGLRFRIRGERSSPLAAGSRIEYRIRWIGIPIRWVTRITEWQPPREFEDVQEIGPYRRWRHRHRFAEDAAGVEMQDRIDYEMPFGVLGRLVHALRVRSQLEAIFEYRRTAIGEIFGNDSRTP
jgi:ligand-binding SRPBCC domain-containing protein